jgi:hypothetical protein
MHMCPKTSRRLHGTLNCGNAESFHVFSSTVARYTNVQRIATHGVQRVVQFVGARFHKEFHMEFPPDVAPSADVLSPASQPKLMIRSKFPSPFGYQSQYVACTIFHTWVRGQAGVRGRHGMQRPRAVLGGPSTSS